MQGKSVFGYKVFGPGWLCENSSLRDVDSRDGEIIVYGFGMDFYKSLTECFKYYDFDNNNRVAEVVASQNIKTEGDRSFPGMRWSVLLMLKKITQMTRMVMNAILKVLI